MSKSLLGYPLRRAASSEMLFGGVRASQLVSLPPNLVLTHSEDQKLPTLDQEREDMQLEYEMLYHRFLPTNIHPNVRRILALYRARDIWHRNQHPQQYHPRPSELSIAPSSVPKTSRTALGKNAFMPLMSLKPMLPHNTVNHRQAGYRDSRGSLKMELQDGKGYGERAKQRSLWQQDTMSKSRVDYMVLGYVRWP